MISVSYIELTIYGPSDAWESLIGALNEKGALGFIEHDRSLTAYFPDSTDRGRLTSDLELMGLLLEKAGLPLSFSLVDIPDQDWNESWKKGFTRLDVGERFSVLPPWEPVPPDRIGLVIDPGMAFGTGHHETTRSCLVLMERCDGQVGKERFLDLGCGTGLLAIAASRLGYREVAAADTDPLATEAARMNAALNAADTVDIRDGGIEQARGSFDCIAANIISGVLIELAPAIAERLKPGGIAILSGILAEQADEVVAAMAGAGLHARERYPDGKWISLVMAR